jgi:hypothetical protein
LGKREQAIRYGEAFANEVNKGDTRIMPNELEDLLQMRKDLDEHIHLAATLSERQKLADLRNEVTADRAKVKELETRANQVAIANQSRIKTHLDEAERLRLESFDLSADSWELQNRLRAKQVEMYQLEKAIKDARDSV